MAPKQHVRDTGLAFTHEGTDTDTTMNVETFTLDHRRDPDGSGCMDSGH